MCRITIIEIVKLHTMSFITIEFLDILDIVLVAFLLYQVYMMIKGTVAINIFVGISSAYLIWLLVKALNMELLSSILGQVMGVGVIALIIVFQQEIRRFLLLMGTKYFSNRNFSLEYLFSFFMKENPPQVDIESIVNACEHLASTKTGALIAISNKSELASYAETGEILNAHTSSRLLETIFFKNSPLHDGAVIISEDKIYAAACLLPVSEDQTLPKQLGLRHRAAMGLSEITDALVLIISEETGYISYTQLGKIKTNVRPAELERIMREKLKIESPEQKNGIVKRTKMEVNTA